VATNGSDEWLLPASVVGPALSGIPVDVELLKKEISRRKEIFSERKTCIHEENEKLT